MVITRGGGEVHLTLLACSYLSFTVKLLWDADRGGYKLDEKSLRQEISGADWLHMQVHDYTVELDGDLVLLIKTEPGQRPTDYMPRHTVHLHSVQIVRKAFA